MDVLEMMTKLIKSRVLPGLSFVFKIATPGGTGSFEVLQHSILFKMMW